MTSRERVIAALNHKPVDRTPRDMWEVPGILLDRADEHRELLERFPLDFVRPDATYGKSLRAKGTFGVIGTLIDAWGSEIHTLERGVCGEVKVAPLRDWSALSTWKPPYELLDDADLSKVDAGCANTDGFVLAYTETRPFERLQALRGPETLFLDLAYGSKEMYQLLDILHDFYVREMTMWANTDVDGVAFGDDWGTQTALLISPEMWRDVFKPLYRDYCDILRSKGKYVFFHSDGMIRAIYPDIVELGISALNSQLFCMDIEEIGAQFAGKITFWGEIDRQHILTRTPEDVRAAVRRVKAALGCVDGGMIAQCSWGTDNPVENIAAVFEEWS